MPVDIEYLNSRYQALEGLASNFRTLQQHIGNYFRVSQNNITEKKAKGQAQTNKLFSSEPIFAVNTFANFMHSSLMPRNATWVAYEFEDEQLNNDDQAADWMAEAGKVPIKYLRLGNFYSETHKAFLDASTFGTSPVRVDEGPVEDEGFGGLLFKTLPCGSYVIAEDAWGKIDTLMRKFQMDARQIVQLARDGKNRWDEKTLPQFVHKANKESPDKQMDLLQAVYPRTDTERKAAIKGPLSWKWASVYAILTPNKALLSEHGEEEFPYGVFRMEQVPGEVMGRGPCYIALPDARELNYRVEIERKTAMKDYLPPLIAKSFALVDGVIDNEPDGLTEVGSAYQNIPLGDLVNRLELGGDKPKMELGKKELITSIWRIFMVDQILALSQEDTPQETATKTYIRWQIAHQILGPAGDDLEREIASLLSRSFNICYRAGVLPPLPASLSPEGEQGEGSKRASLSFRYTSPFARAQQAGEIEATQKWLSWIFGGPEGAGGLINIYPEARYYPDMPKIIKRGGRILGVPEDLVRNQVDIDQDIEAAKQEQAAMNEQAETQSILETAGKAAPAMKVLMEAQQSGGIPGIGGENA